MGRVPYGVIKWKIGEHIPPRIGFRKKIIKREVGTQILEFAFWAVFLNATL